MSIPKAGLVLYFEYYDYFPDHKGIDHPDFFYTGDLDIMHKIVDIAGANHCSMFTAQQVVGCLNSSPYWGTDGQTTSWGERMANCYVPSEKGIKYYNNKLKDRNE